MNAIGCVDECYGATRLGQVRRAELSLAREIVGNDFKIVTIPVACVCIYIHAPLHAAMLSWLGLCQGNGLSVRLCLT